MSSGQYRKSLYVTPTDFHINNFGERETEISIDIYFADLSEEQGSAFYQLTDGLDTSKAEMHIKYTLHKDSNFNDKVKDDISGGVRGIQIDKEVFDNINLIFLPALRDAENDLKPSRNSQLAHLLLSAVPENEDKQRIAGTIISANEIVKADPAIQSVQEIINTNLGLIEKDELQQKVTINLLQPTFESIAASLNVWYLVEHKYLRMLKTDLEDLQKLHGVSAHRLADLTRDLDEENILVNLQKMKSQMDLITFYEELIKTRIVSDLTVKQNGLGYNNILSMAASLGDLEKQPNVEEISIFLVEEPEAHLHPQLLDLLFNFFKKSNKEDKVQIILTSHSPTLVSKADIDHLNILYEYGDTIYCSSLAALAMENTDKEDLKRYLDVTKSQLFFAKRVLFVEGISEAILLLEFANYLGKPFDKYSVEIVNIDGVAFTPFAQLFKENESHSNLRYPCVIVSDNDKCTNQDDQYVITKKELTYSNANIVELRNKLANGSISYRAQKLLEYISNILVKLAEKTLEYELALIPENNTLLLQVLKPLHSDIHADIQKHVDAKDPQDEIAIRIWLAIRDCKGVFAQRLAQEINNIYTGKRKDVKFVVPKYITESINHLIS